MVEIQVRAVGVVELRELRVWSHPILLHPIRAVVEVVMVKVLVVDLVVQVALVW
jgi:hypothetical protein